MEHVYHISVTVCVQCVDLSEEEVSSRAPEDYDRGGPLFVSFCEEGYPFVMFMKGLTCHFN